MDNDDLNDLETRVEEAMRHVQEAASRMEQARNELLAWAWKARSDGVPLKEIAAAANVRPVTLKTWLTGHDAQFHTTGLTRKSDRTERPTRHP